MRQRTRRRRRMYPRQSKAPAPSNLIYLTDEIPLKLLLLFLIFLMRDGHTELHWGRNSCGVANYLPSCGSFFNYEEKIAGNVAASCFGSLEMKVSGYSGELLVQRLHLEIRKTQCSHLFFGAVTLAIGVQH